MSFQHIHQVSSSIESVWLNTKLAQMRVQFKSSDFLYTYSIQENYISVVTEMLKNSSSLGKTVNFIIRSEAVTLVSKQYKESTITIQD